MKKKDVPQDHSKAFEGQRKAVYAIDDEGHYEITTSSGWDAEEVVLDLAIAQYKEQTTNALERVKKELSAPLEYHMYHQRMDLTVLAQSTGYFKWQVKRHLRPAVFATLSPAKLQCYANALGLSVTELQQLPTT